MGERSKTILVTALALGLVGLAGGVEAQTKNTGAVRYRLVRAHCTTGPCNPSYSFVSGSVQLKWPKTAQRSSSGVIGNVNLKTVAIVGGTVGTTLPDSMSADISGTRVFGSDPSSDCPFADSVQTGTFGTASVSCFDSTGSLRCNGDILFDPPENPNCQDTDVRVQDITVEITPDADTGVDTNPLARAGRAIIGEVALPPLTEPTSGARHRLVQAYCTTGPCAPGYTFKTGIATLKRTRYTKLTTATKIGRVKIAKLKDASDEAPPAVDVEITATSHYGDDPTADCALANTTSSGTFATASLPCKKSGKCVGDLFLPTTIDAACTDVDWTLEDVRISVYEDGMVGVPTSLIAVDGKALLGQQ